MVEGFKKLMEILSIETKRICCFQSGTGPLIYKDGVNVGILGSSSSGASGGILKPVVHPPIAN